MLQTPDINPAFNSIKSGDGNVIDVEKTSTTSGSAQFIVRIVVAAGAFRQCQILVMVYLDIPHNGYGLFAHASNNNGLYAYTDNNRCLLCRLF